MEDRGIQVPPSLCLLICKMGTMLRKGSSGMLYFMCVRMPHMVDTTQKVTNKCPSSTFSYPTL